MTVSKIIRIATFAGTAILTGVLMVSWPSRVLAQDETEPGTAPMTLTLGDAINIALQHNYGLRQNKLDVEQADWRVRQGYGQAMPKVTATSEYQRNLASPNPFAGSSAGGIFESLSFLDWLSYNEDARTDNDPTTTPLSLNDFRDRQQQGLDAANITVPTSNNPFQVDNQFTNYLSLTQTLYDGSLYGGIRAAKMYREMSQSGLARKVQIVVRDTKIAFYAALFAAEQVEVVRKSVDRTGRTVKEAEIRLAQGVSSKYDKLSAEVELANLQSDLVRAESGLSNSLDNLKLQIGLPTTQPIVLKGSLKDDVQDQQFHHVALSDVLDDALAKRPDLEQAALSVELNDLNRRVEGAARYPKLSAFLNLGYVGNVPDNRTTIGTVAGDPFSYYSQSSGFFDGAYWNSSLAVGLTLKWTLFNGFQTKAKVQQAMIDRERAEVQYQQLKNQITSDIQAARRDLFTADKRMSSQIQNVSKAELNYKFASTRVSEGVSSRLEERQASNLLDESRLNYNRAMYDYLVAQANFEAAVGTAVSDGGSMATNELTGPRPEQR